MRFSYEFDEAMRSWRKEQSSANNKKEEKRKKILALINDSACTDGEREAAKMALERLG